MIKNNVWGSKLPKVMTFRGLNKHFKPNLWNFQIEVIHLCQSAAELLMLVQKSKMAAAAILNYNFVMLDHPRSPFMHLKFPFKFRVDRVRTFWDIAIRKFRKFGLKCLFRPPKSYFWGVLTPKHYFFIIETPKRPYLTRKHAFWAINGRDRSSGVTCRREQEYKKRKEHKK